MISGWKRTNECRRSDGAMTAGMRNEGGNGKAVGSEGHEEGRR